MERNEGGTMNTFSPPTILDALKIICLPNWPHIGVVMG